MAGALPGKEKQTKKTINHGLKNTFKKTRSNFFLFRSPAAEDTRKDVIRHTSLSLSLSAAAETFQPDLHPKKKKKWIAQEASLYLATGNRLGRQAHLRPIFDMSANRSGPALLLRLK